MPHSHFLNKVIQSRKWESWPLSKICRCNKLVFGCKNVDGSSPPEDISPLAMQYSGPDNSSPCIAIYYQFIAGQVFAGNPICDASDNRQLAINLLLIIKRSASSVIILWQKTAWPKLCLGNYPTTPGPLGGVLWASGERYPCFLIEWIFYWIESSQIKNVEKIFELNFLGK